MKKSHVSSREIGVLQCSGRQQIYNLDIGIINRNDALIARSEPEVVNNINLCSTTVCNNTAELAIAFTAKSMLQN